jgi:RloB-like protein
VSRRSNPHADKPLHKSKGPSREHRVVYVAVEGESTEVDYFDYIKELIGDRQITLHVLYKRNGLKPQDTVDKILDDAEDKAERWVMFDRDEHSEIPEAFARAKKHDIEVVFSNPSFDLWLLLHFTPFSGAQNGSSDVVHKKLRKQPAFETFALSHGDKSLKGARIEAIRGKEPIATQNAKKLTEDCATAQCSEAEGHADHCAPLSRDPSTDVGRLLASLKIIDA